MNMRDEGWTVGALTHPTIEADPEPPPMRTVYSVRDEQVVPLEVQRQKGRRPGLVQGLLELGDGLAGLAWMVLRIPLHLGVGVGLFGAVACGLLWLVTRENNAVKYALVALGLVVVSYTLQFLSHKIQGAVSRWVASGKQRS